METRNLWLLLSSFLQVGLFSIGGGYATIPLIQQCVVEENRWLTMREFADIITISQMTPGPLAVNTSTFVGIRLAGLPGAVIATFGCVISGLAISLLLYKFFKKNESSKMVSGMLDALKAASAGLIASAGSAILLLAVFGVSGFDSNAAHLNTTAVVLFFLGLFALRKYKMNPILLVALGGGAGYLLY